MQLSHMHQQQGNFEQAALILSQEKYKPDKQLFSSLHFNDLAQLADNTDILLSSEGSGNNSTHPRKRVLKLQSKQRRHESMANVQRRVARFNTFRNQLGL